MSNIVKKKKMLRTELKRRRQRIVRPQENSQKVCKRVVEDVCPAAQSTVSGFWPMGKEVDLRAAMSTFVDQGHIVALPVVKGAQKPLAFRSWKPGEPLVPEGFGVSVPPSEKEEVDPDVLLVPLLAFDRQGQRLGYGGGFYDMTIRHLREKRPVLAVGVAYALQEVEEVPTDATDEVLDGIVTEQESIPVTDEMTASVLLSS